MTERAGLRPHPAVQGAVLIAAVLAVAFFPVVFGDRTLSAGACSNATRAWQAQEAMTPTSTTPAGEDDRVRIKGVVAGRFWTRVNLLA